MIDGERCNGWSNRETWLVNLWFCDNVETYEDFLSIKSMVEDEINGLEGFLSDMIREDKINWDELCKTILENEE